MTAALDPAHAGAVKVKRYTFGMPWRMLAARFTRGSGLPILFLSAPG